MGSVGGTEESLNCILAKYEEERQKRLRPEGIAQFEGIARSEKFKHFAADPWVEDDNYYASQPLPIADDGHSKVIVTGAGYGALIFAVRLITEANFKPEDFVFVDSAWGFGGTWYWNRYPGLMCDVESACYLPLLEETGFIPKHRYSYGPELRKYAELVAEKYGLRQRALFGSTVQDAKWNDTTSEWVFSVKRKSPSGIEQPLKLRSDFFVLASGLLNRPKLARLDGLDSFKGHIFHTSRWDYTYTGGSPENPMLEKLKGKKVAIIGTGATAIQAVPELAKWVAQLYVFQRTPSAVDVRGQRQISEDWFRQEIATKEGWQQARRENMAAFLSNSPDLPAENLVDDGWTHFPSFSGLVGSPHVGNVTHENVDKYVESLHRLDLPRQEQVRARASKLVRDPDVADSLKPWYPGWCKRPCFHDDYLDTFNLPNVKLVDTEGRGVDGLSENGVLIKNHEYEVDLLVLGTGFESYTVGSPAYRAGISVTGRDNLSMDDKWAKGPATLHGVFSRGFPNLILPGPRQAGATTNVVHSMDVLAQHTAHIMKAAEKRVQHGGSRGKKLVIEPTRQGEEEWALRVTSHAYAYAGLSSCTPSYATAEGKMLKTMEEKLIAARGAAWGKGLLDFIQVIKVWEDQGDLDGLEISLV